MVTWQFKFLLKYWNGHISKYNLKLKQIKTCQLEEINKVFKIKKIQNKIKKLLK